MGPEIEQKVANGDILLAFQTWNNDHQWWIPNMNPPDLMLDGVPITPTTHDHQWYEFPSANFFTPEVRDDDLLKLPARQHDMLSGYKNIQYEHLHTLGNNKYIYPVIIHNSKFFGRQEELGFKYVDSKVFEDVHAGRAKIVLIFPLEGFGNLPGYRDYAILDKWCLDAGFNKDQVYYIHGDFNGPTNVNYTYVPVSAFPCWLPHPRGTITEYQPITLQNLFLSYTRRAHDHRLIFTCELLKHNLLDRGIVSYYGGTTKDSRNRVRQLNRDDLAPFAEKLDQIRPLELDMDLETNNPASNINYSHYRQTFASIVLETHCNATTLFFSEKIWKAISVGHPFLLIAGMGYLAQLKKLGYQTFDRWFDESYDTMPNLSDRIKCVVKQLIKLSKLSTEELVIMRKEMEPVLKHNHRLFKFYWFNICQGDPNEYLYLEIKKIWDSF
jgi:hypothetical protein